MIADTALLVAALAGFAVLYGMFLRRVRRPSIPDFSIVVDGSNVMYWGGDPSAHVLTQVLRALEGAGHTPLVIFDASVGYRLGDQYFDEVKLSRLIGLPSSQIVVVNKGVIADDAILSFATDQNLRIVSNDQFRDWRVQFPHVAKKGQLLRGTYSHGAVHWRGKP